MIETLEQAKEYARKVVGCTDSQRALKLLLNEVERLQRAESMLRRIPDFNNVPGYTTGTEINDFLSS